MKKTLLLLSLYFGFSLANAQSIIDNFLRYEKTLYILQADNLVEVTEYKKTSMQNDSLCIEGKTSRYFKRLPNNLLRVVKTKKVQIYAPFSLNDIYILGKDDTLFCLPCYLGLDCNAPIEPIRVN